MRTVRVVRARSWRVAVGVLAVFGLLIPFAPQAGAVFSGTNSNTGLTGDQTNTDLTVASPCCQTGQGVTGFFANANNPFDPVLDGYPNSATPPSGFTESNEGYAGVILGTPTSGTGQLSLYCFDLHTDTWEGIGYTLGTWDAANVPNVGYVARILSEYYPFVPTQPAGLSNTSQMAAATQAAIWYFSDRYVLSNTDPLYTVVAGIVAKIITEGPLPPPAAPSLSITPTFASSPSTGVPAGPFTVISAPASATVKVTATGANMYSDATATTLIPNGTAVPSGQQIWLKSTGTTAATLQATATAGVPEHNIYLYDGNTPNVSDAQRLILALPSTLTTNVYAQAEFQPVGSLTIEKTIAGPAAGHEAAVTVEAVCGRTPLTPPLVVASGTPAGTTSRTYTGLAAGTNCTVIETVDGAVAGIVVTTVGNPQDDTIPAGGTAVADITDTYHYTPGSLVVSKLITGDGAALRGDITIQVSCNGSPLPDYVIPATTSPADVVPMQYPNIQAGSKCTISEPTDGSNTQVTPVVSATVNGTPVTLPTTVTVATATVVDVDITDDYGLNPGKLIVTKTIAGPGAGTEDAVTITVSCDGVPATDTPDFTIAANTPAGDYSHTYDHLPGDTVCTVTETVDGSSNTVVAEVTTDNGEPTIPPGGTATTTITDNYITSGLVVTKTITGTGAGREGTVTITVSCTGVPVSDTPDFVIPAGTPAGETYKEYTGIPLGTPCTITETGDGANPPSETVVTTVVPSTGVVTVDPVGEVDVTDDYTYLTGALAVTKTIAGAAAGHEGAVTIEAFCEGQELTPVFTIPAGTTGSPSHTYSGIPAGTHCVVAETVDGSTKTVAVTVSDPVQAATIPSTGGTDSVGITDTYFDIPGSILVEKILGGPFTGQQGAITFTATCGSTVLPTFVIPAGTQAGLRSHSYDNIPAGSRCTITETADGSTSAVTTRVLPNNTRTVSVPAAKVVPVLFADLFTDTPGTLTVTKTIAGSAAGQQGEIEILVNCGEPSDQFGFDIPPDFPAGTVSRSFDDIPAGSTCTVTETNTGQTSSVTVAVAGSGQKVTIAAAQTSSAKLTDTFAHPASAAAAATSGSTLPFTGAATGRLVGLGLLAVAGGTGLLLASTRGRRRRR